MRFFAILTMFIAWLFYGAMPALANCPICDSAMTMPAMSSVSIHAAMADMPGMTNHGSMAMHTDKKPDNPCADGMAHVLSCAACLAVAPLLTLDDGKALAFSYPAPTHGQRLHDSRPAPTAPPPRFA